MISEMISEILNDLRDFKLSRKIISEILNDLRKLSRKF